MNEIKPLRFMQDYTRYLFQLIVHIQVLMCIIAGVIITAIYAQKISNQLYAATGVLVTLGILTCFVIRSNYEDLKKISRIKDILMTAQMIALQKKITEENK